MTQDDFPAEATTKKAGLGSLFSAAAAALTQKQTGSWQHKGNHTRHEKKIGAAPNGTRRSMGKR